MPRVEARQRLLAPREDVWAFVAEPHHLPDWWPGVSGVVPDRRGAAAGARWQITGLNRPSLLRRPNPTGTLVVTRSEAGRLLAWHLTGERMDVELTLEATASNRTLARLVVEGPWLIGLNRALPRRALIRLHALCQTAAGL